MIALGKSKTKGDLPGRMMEAFDLYSPEIDADPFPYYEILREQYPCYWSESGNLWILSRYDDIVEATRDWETFSSSQGNMIDELPGRAGATLGTTDPPRHDRLRALSQAAFARRNVEQFIAPALDIADRALDRICDRKEFEFINDFSSQITVGVLFRTMGLPERDHAEIRRKVILAVSTDKSVKGRNPQHIAAFKELSDFLTAEVAVRRANPTDDLITHLAEAEIDGDRLSEREVVLTTATFVMAGVESLSSFMSMFALNLHDHPDARRRIVANPALIEPAIEESLRFNTSAQRFKRTIMRETELHGQKMRIGDKVALAFGSGNRDWRKFPDPDVYDIDRRPQGHLGFGAGKHFCLGSQMARLVTASAMKRFLERVPEYHLAADEIAWNSSSNFRSPSALPFARP
jgi:cytochrome P450